MTTVEIRGTAGDLLHRTVARGTAELRAACDDADRTLPWFVWHELARYGACGDPEEGFAWLHCPHDDHHRLVPFSCKGRAFCPACIGRRMAEMARRWCDTLLPDVPYRQWVITVPWARRKLLAYRPGLARGVLALALEEIFGWYRAEARQVVGRAEVRCGAVTAQQRWGSALNLNLHYHSLVPDGVFARGGDGEVVFHRLHPGRADLEALVQRIASRSEAWLASQWGDDEPDPEDAQASLIAAAVEGRAAAGPRVGGGARRTVDVSQSRAEGLGKGVSCDGYGLHAGTTVSAGDTVGRERLVRYFLRPPLAKGRLEELPDGQVRWRMRRPWADGTTGFVFTSLELTQRLAAFVVPRRVHTVHYHGVFAPRSAWRADVVPDPEEVRAHHEALERGRAESALRKRAQRQLRKRRSTWCPWSELLERVFAVGGTRCPHCGRAMVVRAIVIGRPATTRVLRGLAKSARGPP